MLLSIKNLSTYKIEATDGSIGQVHSFLLDDQKWIVRYLVVDTAVWLPGRKVLISPTALEKPQPAKQVFPVALTREQIKNSPDIDAEKSVSRQQEIELSKHYNWTPYWGYAAGPPMTPYAPVIPAMRQPEQKKSQPPAPEGQDEQADCHLRNSKEIIGYRLHAKDGEIGQVEDFIADTEEWVIRYMIADTQKWLSGKKVIIPPDWIQDIVWSTSEVFVDMTKQMIKDSPPFDPAAPVNKEYEIRFYDYYGRPGYWG